MLSPAENVLWNAYFSLEPFGSVYEQLCYVEAAIRKTDSKSMLPPECSLNQPIEDMDEEKQDKMLVKMFTDFANIFLHQAGQETVRVPLDSK